MLHEDTVISTGECTIYDKVSSKTIFVPNYDKVFNFFDTRDYTTRAFSTDFLSACRKNMHKTKVWTHEIIIAIPDKYFDQDMNDLLRTRIIDEFKRELIEFRRESIKKNIYAFLAIIIALTVIAAYGYMTETLTEYGVWFTVFLELLYVCAYFGIWGGCDILVFDRSERMTAWLKKSRLANVRITFQSIST
jgi:hypothetical protein